MKKGFCSAPTREMHLELPCTLKVRPHFVNASLACMDDACLLEMQYTLLVFI